MNADTPCVHCQTVGFVRREHVITAAAAQICTTVAAAITAGRSLKRMSLALVAAQREFSPATFQTAHARRKPE